MLSKPQTYVACRLPPSSPPLRIDGDLSKPEWAEAIWSEPFDEIRGQDAPEGTRPSTAQRTRIKMMWDDTFLYVGAIIESDREVVSTFTERNSPIFQKDSDFEVFIDPAGSCHWYKELEINAANVVWNLMLSRPYIDGGGELSGRVARMGDVDYYEVMSQRTATRILRGKLGDPTGATWAVELALAHADTLHRLPGVQLPTVGTRWRINFSRVEARGVTNWVWAPQRVWDAQRGHYEGKVNMHLPDAWGVVQFAPPEGAAPKPDPSWRARQAAMSIYYAQRARRDERGAYTLDVSELRVDEKLVDSFVVRIEPASGGLAHGYVAVVSAPDLEVRVTDSRLITVSGTQHDEL